MAERRLRAGRAFAAAILIAALAAALLAGGALAAHHHHHAKRAKLSISDTSVKEPDGSATAKARFKVSLSKKAKRTVKASWGTVNGSAGTTDFQAANGRLVIKKHHRRTHLSVTVLGDNQHEGNETFHVKLSHVKGAKAKRSSATATIIDNDSGGGGGHAPDADGDGIPDSLDACPNVPDPDGYCPKSVYAVNDGTVGPGSKVRVNDLMITAVDRTDNVAWAGEQPSDSGWQGAKYSALELDDSAGLPVALAIGDRISVAGTSGSGGFDVVSITTSSTGGTPVPAGLSVANVGDPKYDAVLGTLSGETLTSPGAQWTLFSGVGVGSKIITSLPSKPAGTYFSSITGISSGSVASPSLLPRINADIVEGTMPARSVTTLHMTDDCVNVNEVGVKVGVVTLDGPAPVGGATVTAATSQPSAITLLPLSVPAGTNHGNLMASGGSSASAISFTASLPANGSPISGDGVLDVRDVNVGDTACSIDTN